MSPAYYLCYNISADGIENPEVLEPRSQVIRDPMLWENLPKFSESIKVDGMDAENSAIAIFSGAVSLPYSLVIYNFDAPAFVANYTLKISSNIIYRLEGTGRY